MGYQLLSTSDIAEGLCGHFQLSVIADSGLFLWWGQKVPPTVSQW